MVQGKKKTSSGLGNTLTKARAAASHLTASDRHSQAEHGEEKESVTQQSNLDEFLANASLAGADFTAERLNMNLVRVEESAITSVRDRVNHAVLRAKRQRYRGKLKIPRRPAWTAEMTPGQLDEAERTAFLHWRRELATLEEVEGLTVTPFEKNLEFWRQLWRVVERSHVVVQVLDARNPLLFRSLDLEAYVDECGEGKKNFLLLNKADLLTPTQRDAWARYFDEEKIAVSFFAATLSDEELAQETTLDEAADDGQSSRNSSAILSCDQLIEVWKDMLDQESAMDTNGDPVTLAVGMTGYPNVGKSSTINKLFGRKVVAVSATPGRTKHFQTHYLEPRLMLVDCPGLVMPSVASSREEMVIMGVLSIDQMRDYVAPVQLVCQQASRRVFQNRYGITLPRPGENEDPARPPTAHELLICLAYVRGFMSAKGIPDESRAARVILKDYISGSLLYCYPPPNTDEKHFQSESLARHTGESDQIRQDEQLRRIESKNLLPKRISTTQVDTEFFDSNISGVHVKSTAPKANQGTHPATSEKPWRQAQKQKRNSKEKSRKLYRHLDA